MVLLMCITKNEDGGGGDVVQMINMNASELCGSLMSSGFIGEQQIMKRCPTPLLFRSLNPNYSTVWADLLSLL